MTSTSQAGAGSAIRNVLGFTFRHWGGEKRLAAAVALAITAATLADVFVPFFAGRLVDALGAPPGERGEAAGEALTALGAMTLLGVAYVACRHLAWASIVPMTLRIMSRVSAHAFGRVQRLSTDWHADSFSGSTVRQITRGMWSLDLLHDVLLLALLPSATVLAGTVLLLGWQWPLLGALMGAGSLAYVLVTVLLSVRFVAPTACDSNRHDTRVGGVLADALACNAVVKSFGAEEREEARLREALADWGRATSRTWIRGTWSGTIQVLILWSVRIGVSGAALWLWSRGEASAGDVAYVLTTTFVVNGYLRDIGMHVSNLQKSVNEMEELVELNALAPQIRDAPGARDIAVARGEIRFSHVRFHYPRHDVPLYDDLDVAIRAGERVGLVGPSGSGKTTFVKLLQRLHEVNGGRILIDGQDVAAATQGSLRRSIALVPQESVLFHRSLRDNIAYGRPEAGDEEVRRAARLAHAEEFIDRLPQGFATAVGERGVKLSGGERQRIALARAFLADAPILVLDEATSALDSESERLIQAATERLMEGRTALVIAHRLSTVRDLDRILVFSRGRIVEDGPHRELVARPHGAYRRLVEHQSGPALAVGPTPPGA